MIEYKNFYQALLITGDGDFYCLVKFLYKRTKLKIVLAPHPNSTSSLLKISAQEKLLFMDKLKYQLAYKNEKAPHEDETT